MFEKNFLRKKFPFQAACLIFALLINAAPASAERYENARFGYSVDVPDDFEWLPEAANGDGRVFRHKADPRFTITFYARIQHEDDDTLAAEGASHIPSGAEGVSETISENSYRAAFREGDVYTGVSVFLEREVFCVAIARSPTAENEKFRQLTAGVMRTWKTGGGSPCADWR